MREAYVVYETHSEGDRKAIAVAYTEEEAQSYRRQRVSELNQFDLGLGGRHKFDPYNNSRVTIEEVKVINEVIDQTPVWYVIVSMWGTDSDCKIIRYLNKSKHITYFPEWVNEIPTSEYKHLSGKGAYIFSKVSLEDAFKKAEAYAKEKGWAFKYGYGLPPY